jgi:hypothetical protein
VQQPLDASTYIGDPCASLTQNQLDNFEVSRSGEVGDQEGAPSCNWAFGPNGETRISVSYLVDAETGLSNLYALNDTGRWDNGYFEPTVVSGYPAAYVDMIDTRSSGDCSLSVGIKEDLMFGVIVQSRPGNDSCKAAENVASAVIETIKQGA